MSVTSKTDRESDDDDMQQDEDALLGATDNEDESDEDGFQRV